MACHAVLAPLLWLSAALAALRLPAAAGAGGPLPPPSEGCLRQCGSVDIPFPFGHGPPHCMLPGFLIECRDTGNGSHKPFLGTSNVEVISISLPLGQAQVLNYISSYCYDAASGKMKPSEWYWNLTGTPYTLSDTANKFTVLGCRTLAYIGDSMDDAATYMTGCVAMCRLPDLTALRNDSCSGMGCCQTAIPKGLKYYQVWFDQRLSTSENHNASPCSYAVLMESSNFTFSTSYLTTSELHGGQVPVVLDWAIGHDDCDACVSSNSQCFSAAGRRGYICNCTEGFQGNPYLPDGCQDINECDDPATYSCFGNCINTNGTFNCSCPVGTRGNASIEDGCQKDPFPPRARLAVGIVAGLLVALIAFLATEVLLHKRSNKRQGYFEEHGGQMLSQILKTEGNITFTFYDRGDIVKATRSFHKANIVGEGAHGTVYKAIIGVGDTTTTVAVKRCKEIDKSRTMEFVQELVILCRVSHPNIVRLLGCCLHFEAPMLVYEFMQNGTLNDLLHGRPRRRVTLATRLRIAAEAAEALAHLHSPPHTTLHGDVKPENILLGDGLVAKVSDFGCSTIDDNIQVVPKGTLAYLDPEFLQDFQLTDKSDVYSYGVTLMELLTGKKPLAKEQKNLTIMFQESMGNGTLGELLDTDIVEEGAMGVIHQTAELASRCTSVPGKARPAMGQVAEELRRLSNIMPERSQALQALEGHGYSYTATENETTGFHSLGSKAALSTELAR
ncbi:wall-associated receptor kinase 2-like [Phragmites australis]|uniref:wall-associated receptor kinase 2-like n=1 Tax=Phragmites australis TaxID=29695 RepID=UPI002D76717F|nr:wall-associated receptor kinase 2-like [Phragmites australis]